MKKNQKANSSKTFDKIGLYAKKYFSIPSFECVESRVFDGSAKLSTHSKRTLKSLNLFFFDYVKNNLLKIYFDEECK